MHYRYRSFFWPVLLIAIGVIALLVNANVLSADRLYLLSDLWPVILIVIGLELITRRALHGVTSDVAAALIVLIAAGGAVAYVAVGPRAPNLPHTLDTSESIGKLNFATLQVSVGTANITVEGNSTLGTDLYQAHIVYSGPKPTVALDRSTGNLRISQGGGLAVFGNRRFILVLEISPSVTWSININTGAADATLKLTEVRVDSIELNTGASRADITVGSPYGITPITVQGGALTVHVHRPSGTEAAAQVSGAVVSLTGDGQEDAGVGSKSWQSDGYAAATDAFKIQVSGGACTVSVDAADLSS
jgi:uncharacterized membrane protein YhaH (DUF805 family)